MTIFVTGGAGFIGSHFIDACQRRLPASRIVNFDKLTYAGNLANCESAAAHPGYSFYRGDVCRREQVLEALPQHCDMVVHFAAESHVDRSIQGSDEFVRTNVLGTQVLLDAARERGVGRFLHISTDEVGGSMQPYQWFHEKSPLDPRSPYAASKAAAEHLVRAAGATFGLDYVITRTSNNYGPRQFPEKLIPLAICNALEGRPIPVYGDGMQVRDWVHVEDNCRALLDAMLSGGRQETYHIGGGRPCTNRELLQTLLEMLAAPSELLQPVTDRLGHDRRYQVDYRKLESETGWRPRTSLRAGLRETVDWYRHHPAWIDAVRSGEYLRYYALQYGVESATAARQ